MQAAARQKESAVKAGQPAFAAFWYAHDNSGASLSFPIQSCRNLDANSQKMDENPSEKEQFF